MVGRANAYRYTVSYAGLHYKFQRAAAEVDFEPGTGRVSMGAIDLSATSARGSTDALPRIPRPVPFRHAVAGEGGTNRMGSRSRTLRDVGRGRAGAPYEAGPCRGAGHAGADYLLSEWWPWHAPMRVYAAAAPIHRESVPAQTQNRVSRRANHLLQAPKVRACRGTHRRATSAGRPPPLTRIRQG